MTDRKLLSPGELVAMCRDFMTRTPADQPDPDHEGWNSQLVLTPRMVEQILLANTEQ